MNAARIEEILTKADALLTGHFILTSGRHAAQYLQCAKVFQYPAFTEELAKNIASHFMNEEIGAVVGPATGGILLAYEIARQLGVRSLFTEREEGKMVLRRGFSLPNHQKVLVVEDVITTGQTVLEVIEFIRSIGGEVAAAAVIVDRSMGAASFDVPYHALYAMNVMSWPASDCPLCDKNDIPAVKPGSRGIK
jgi:orotate phosphoribosyltransferase